MAKVTKALEKLLKEGYAIETTPWNTFEAKKADHRTIEIAKNGREDQIASIKVSNSYPTTLKRALHLSATLGK